MIRSRYASESEVPEGVFEHALKALWAAVSLLFWNQGWSNRDTEGFHWASTEAWADDKGHFSISNKELEELLVMGINKSWHPETMMAQIENRGVWKAELDPNEGLLPVEVQAVKALEELTERAWRDEIDAEVAHRNADDVLVTLLRQLGADERVLTAWASVPKWYA